MLLQVPVKTVELHFINQIQQKIIKNLWRVINNDDKIQYDDELNGLHQFDDYLVPYTYEFYYHDHSIHH